MKKLNLKDYEKHKREMLESIINTYSEAEIEELLKIAVYKTKKESHK